MPDVYDATETCPCGANISTNMPSAQGHMTVLREFRDTHRACRQRACVPGSECFDVGCERCDFAIAEQTVKDCTYPMGPCICPGVHGVNR